MYTDRGRAPGHHQRPLQHAGPCQCPHCVCYEPPYPHRGEPGYRVPLPPTEQADRRGDVQAPSLRDVGGGGGRAFAADRSGPRHPQRRPVFAAPGTYGQSDDVSPGHPWDPSPAQWKCPPEPGARHYAPVREQCDCVVWADAGTRPFNTRPPQPLPPPQFRGQVRHRRSVKYVSEEEERCWECDARHYHLDPHAPFGLPPGRLHVPNGHCGPRPVRVEGGDERDSRPSRLQGGSEGGCNGRSRSQEAFFSTEVPQRNQLRRKGAHVAPADPSSKEPQTTLASDSQHRHHRPQGPDLARQKGRQKDSVRDQIRQVVTDLEGVLGGLKQVHVEMREVVDHIDRLTANIDLSEQQPSIAPAGAGVTPHQGGHAVTPHQGGRAVAPHQGGHGVALLPSHQHRDEDHIILRTNSPSPIHMAAVVKTNRIALPKENQHDRRGMNGHPPHLYPARDSNHAGEAQPEAPPRSLDPTVVVVGNSTSGLENSQAPAVPPQREVREGPRPASRLPQGSRLPRERPAEQQHGVKEGGRAAPAWCEGGGSAAPVPWGPET